MLMVRSLPPCYRDLDRKDGLSSLSIESPYSRWAVSRGAA